MTASGRFFYGRNMANKKIQGRKGGSSSRTPTEQPDDLQSVAKAKFLLALGEGEFSGGLTGQSIFLDGTPLLNADGSSNFSGAWEFRLVHRRRPIFRGCPVVKMKSLAVWLFQQQLGCTPSLTTAFCRSPAIKWPSIFRQEDDGDLVGYPINYAIDLQTNGGAFQTNSNSVTGKTTSGYERSHRINLPAVPQRGHGIRKITADANSAKIGDTMTLQSYTEVIDAKLRYPNTALLYIEFDSASLMAVSQIMRAGSRYPRP
jgi:predicted phage tail protein